MVSDRSWHNGLPRFGGRFKEIRLTQSQPGEDHVLRIGPMSLSGQGFRAGKVKNDPELTSVWRDLGFFPIRPLFPDIELIRPD
jgi:hypothetical protein